MIKQNEKKISDDRILQEDLERLVYRSSLLNELAGQTVFVTGATGLIGSQIVKTLALYNYIFYTNIKIIALVRNEKKAKKIFSELLSDTNIIICFYFLYVRNCSKILALFIHLLSKIKSIAYAILSRLCLQYYYTTNRKR